MAETISLARYLTPVLATAIGREETVQEDFIDRIGEDLRPEEYEMSPIGGRRTRSIVVASIEDLSAVIVEDKFDFAQYMDGRCERQCADQAIFTDRN